MLSELPKHWPILYALYHLGKIHNNFNLQKYLFLAQREGRVPIKYIFSKEDYGPYCSNIKQDASFLHNQGYINMSFGVGWIFDLTPKGRIECGELVKKIPLRIREFFDQILDKYSSYSRAELGEYVYKNYMKSPEELEELKNQLIDGSDFLLEDFQDLELSSNSLFILGTLDYCRTALKKENLDDVVKKGHLLSVIGGYIEKYNELQNCLEGTPELLPDSPLKWSKEDFEQAQNICSEYGVLPALYDENLDLSELLLEE